MSTALRPEATVHAPDAMLPRIARIRRRRRESAQVWTLDIEADGTEASGFAPGQFNMLTVFGVGEVPISLSGDPARGTQLVHTIRAVGPVSEALVQLKPGKELGLRGPFGVGWPMAEAAGRDVLLVAGGLGLAPLRPALYRLLAGRHRFGRVRLLYGARGPEDMLFRRELASWQRRADIDIEITVDHAPSGWTGHVGVVPTLIEHAAFDPGNSIALVCGPEIMMRFAIDALRRAGMADAAIYLSTERNMKCAIGQCGHCQFGPTFVCRDGPVFRYDRLRTFLGLKEI
ncbi:MAG: FAD/NAD(P)-binding protein [Proteobacteria bacterium]|nr:FAD/NAD(P)-binding protein [Pseudomonadota bacterium]